MIKLNDWLDYDKFYNDQCTLNMLFTFFINLYLKKAEVILSINKDTTQTSLGTFTILKPLIVRLLSCTTSLRIISGRYRQVKVQETLNQQQVTSYFGRKIDYNLDLLSRNCDYARYDSVIDYQCNFGYTLDPRYAKP